MKIFVDGVKILTTTKGVVKQARVPWSTPVTIGKLTGKDAEFFAGAMDEFYIFTSALMHAEVEALMSKCEFPSDSKYVVNCMFCHLHSSMHPICSNYPGVSM